MSYDIFAFDPATAPGNDDLLAWYHQHAQDSSYDPAVTTPKLRALYRDLIRDFPPINGPDAATDDDDADTDYAFGRNTLYVSFRWSKFDQARDAFLQLGQAHGVGVCEISESPAVIHRPTGEATASSRASASDLGVASTQGKSAVEPSNGSTTTNANPSSHRTENEDKGEGKLYL